MTNSIRVDKDVSMTTREGFVLRSDIYRPDDSQKHPAIVMRTPYDKSMMIRSGDFISPVSAAFAGYAFVIQDTRGRFASEGEFKPPVPEGVDGYDTVEWVAAEKWCDGNVGMTGLSYCANVQWLTALENPPHLKAISPGIGTASPLVSEVRKGGLRDFDLWITWSLFMAFDMIEKMEKQGRDVSRMREMIERASINPDEVFHYLPLKDAPHFRFEGLSESFAGWLSLDSILDTLPSEDLYWPYEKMKVPCYHVGGWHDLGTGYLFENFIGMREKGGSARAREGQHLLCGPWAHGRTIPYFVGGLNFGPYSKGVLAQVHESHMAFFDRYLRGIDVDIPGVCYFVMGRDRWENADTWPLPQTNWQRFYLHSKGSANTAAGDGLLSRDELGSESPDTFVYDPLFPVPTLGGRSLYLGRLVPGPFDQTPIEKRSDVLCYTTAELDEDLEVTGPLILHLFAATSARDTDFMAKVIDVYPDGTAYNVAEGCVRARYRNSAIHPELINPSEVYEYSIDMAATSIVFRRGHSIRIDITSSNFPMVDRNMNTGNPFGQDAEGISATQSIYHQPEYCSYIDLPVIPPTK